jgi:hypothetical protein
MPRIAVVGVVVDDYIRRADGVVSGERVLVSTGSGGIDVDLPMLVLDRDERHVVVGRAGGDLVASLVIDTGSGSIRVTEGS